VPKRQNISTRFFRIRQPHVSRSDSVKICLTSVNYFFLKFCPKWPTSVDLSVDDIRWQIAAECVEIAQWSQWRAYTGNQTTIALSNDTIAARCPLRLLLPLKWGSQMHSSWPTSRRVPPPGCRMVRGDAMVTIVIDRRYLRDMHTSDVAFRHFGPCYAFMYTVFRKKHPLTFSVISL